MTKANATNVMSNLILNALKSDLPLLIKGKSGWGKTSLVEQAGETLGVEVVKLSLALSLPEDIGGIPSPKGDSFTYLLPDWFYSRRDSEFILFLDEINQAAPQTLHAIYSLVQERRLHGVTNPRMKVMAAGNLNEENPHLTEIMQPLLNRFYVVNFVHDKMAAIRHLNSKYGLALTDIEKSPRDTEQGILAYRAGLPDLAREKAGLTVLKCLQGAMGSKADDLIVGVKVGEVRDRNGFIFKG
jgi:MoxR-like ATPase